MYKVSDKPYLENIIHKLTQEADNCQDFVDEEYLTITVESPIGSLETNPGFYVLQTDQWAIESLLELVPIFEKLGDSNTTQLMEMQKLMINTICHILDINPEVKVTDSVEINAMWRRPEIQKAFPNYLDFEKFIKYIN